MPGSWAYTLKVRCSITAVVPYLVASAAREAGFDPGRLLKATGLELDVPPSADEHVDIERYYELWRRTMELVRDPAQGVRIVAPPIWVLLEVENGEIVPSEYAKAARAAGLDIITWTLERSGRIVEDVLVTKGTASPEFYYQSTLDALRNDGDILVVLDVLARQVGILGIFSDWAATVTYYANCMNR
jgi:glycerophosphoryl diester phosphodiesterase